MSDHIPTLADLRHEIDVLDDQIQDLLRRRAEAVQRVAGAKAREGAPGSVLRPGREAQILRRLFARQKGGLPGAALARIWREMITALYEMQATVKVAVHAPNKSAARWDLARDYYGSTTPLQLCTTASAVLRALSGQPGTLGVMALPEDGEKESWWPLLASHSPDTPRVIARLPFVPNPRGQFADLGAYVIANIQPEESGDDCTLVVLSSDQASPSLARISALLAKAGLEGRVQGQYRQGDYGARVLVDVTGFIADGDPRLTMLVDAESGIADAVVIGAYAVPLQED